MLLLLDEGEPPRGAWRPLREAASGAASAGFAEWGGDPFDDPLPPPGEWPAAMAIVRSGSLAADKFAEEPRNWMGPGRRRLEEQCDRLVGPLAASERTLLWRPHARQILSDLAGTIDFLRRHRGERFGLALAPADLLTPELVESAAEFLPRVLATLAPLASILILEDLRRRGDADLEVVPIGEGELPLEALREAMAMRPEAVPVAIRDRRWRSQAAAVGIAAD